MKHIQNKIRIKKNSDKTNITQQSHNHKTHTHTHTQKEQKKQKKDLIKCYRNLFLFFRFGKKNTRFL